MNLHASVIFLMLIAPLGILPYAAHRLISSEAERGKAVGTAYLQAQAEALAARMQNEAKPIPPEESAALPVLIGVTDQDGRILHGNLPDDGRCTGIASLGPKFPGLSVKVMWRGERNPGLERMRRLHLADLTVYGMTAFIFLVAVGLVLRTLRRTRRALAAQIACARDFSHRLKTPITSISLCAELAQSGRITDERKRECAETIVAEASKLDGIVCEVLQHIEGSDRG